MYMSRRTLVLIPITVAAVGEILLLPPTRIDPLDRARFVAAFVAAGVFCASWLLDGDRPEAGH
jgi:hypothetical protein